MSLKEQIKDFDVIIFDLGGVIIDIDYTATIQRFQSMGIANFDELFSQALQTDLFDRYETGQISSPHFLNLLKEKLGVTQSPNEIVFAWNAMIKGFNLEKLNILEAIKETKTTALLSNINDLHEVFARRKLKEVTDKPLEDFFNYTFLSHKIKARKPDVQTFIYVCKQMGVPVERVLFIDDSIQHVEGARKAGLNAILFPQNARFE